MSAMEIAEGSMSRMVEENESEEMMARVSFLQQLFDRISSPPISELLAKLKLDEGFLNTLKTNLRRLDAILDDAEPMTYWEVKWWLDDLKEVGYELEDLLDKIATERLRHEFESKRGNIETYLEKIISSNTRAQLEEISSRITLVLQRGKEKYDLREASRILRRPYPLSAAKVHLEDESQVYGRDEDKNAIIELLLSDNETDDPVTVIPIVGADGVGKTTLAWFVYNDYRVSEQFDLKGWASVSPNLPFDEGLSKALSEAFSIVDSRNIAVEILKVEKFLLVLDDVPSSWLGEGEKIKTYHLEGAKGSKILLTTPPSPWMYRPKWVLPDYDLKPLNYDGSWMLFVKHAFPDKEIGLHPGLEAIGKNIVAKCHGLPLLIVTLGAMLRFKPSVEEWEAVLRKLSDLDTKKDIDSILWMSYGSLPPNLKRCFAYCSIFPKDHEYDKERLVLLWMAEGFLQHSKRRRIEEVGHEYFDHLASRSFFQKSGANSSRFVMHSLWHKLAEFVSEKFCFSFVNDQDGTPSRRVRHLSLSVESYLELFHCNTSQLRTLLLYSLPPGERSRHVTGLILERAKNWQCLRVLSFSHDTITELPDSIGALKLLHYLDLSHTKITSLPNFVTTLYNLQTLLLSYCHLLSILPKEFRKLVYLRHLDIKETCLKEMPAKMGCLTSLQSLSDFVVGKYSGSNIRELGPLKNVGGTLCISKLQNVVSARDAAGADLKRKADLKLLELKWSDAIANSLRATNVLEKLEPHQNLEKLSIISYNGISFPDWVGDSSFSKMVFLHLSDCNSCSHLPPLGQLPSLKELIIEGMRGIKEIGPEFFGVNNVSAKPFPLLEILVFREMPEWEGWSASKMQPVGFPRLKRMCIKSCPKYENHFLYLPPSAEVEISVSEENSMLPTEETLPQLPFTVEMQLHEGDKVQVRGKEKLQDRPSTAGLLEVKELQNSNSIVWQRADVPITSNRPPLGSLQRLTEDEKRKNVSTMEIVKGSMSLTAEENLSEEKMAQASILQPLYDRICSRYISEFFGELKLHAGLLNNWKSNLLSLDAILDDAESKAYKDEEVKDWFGDLNAVSYDLEVLLNEIASKRVRHHLEYKRWNIKAWFQSIISPKIRDPNIRDRLEEINSRITHLLHTGKCIRLTEDSSAKYGGASKNSSAAIQITSYTDTDGPISDEDDKVQFRRNKKLLDRSSTSRLPEQSQLPDSNVVQRIDMSIMSNSPPQEFPQRLTGDSRAMHGWASDNSLAAIKILSDTDYGKDSQEDISSPEKESLNVNNGGASNNSAAIETSSDTDYSEDSQGDISSLEQGSIKVSQFSQLEKSLTQKLYSLEIEACESLESLPADLKLNNLQHLYIIDCHLLKFIQVSHLPEALKSLYIRKCKVLFLSTAEKHKFLENLCIESSCDSLESFPLAIFPRLRSLCIKDCAKFNSLSITEDHKFLDALEIKNCAQFISFPEEELRIPNLTSIWLSNCKNLKVLPGKLHGLTSLQSLYINECPEVDSVPAGGLPSSLNLVCISFCHKLTPCIEWGLHELNDFSQFEIEDGIKDLESFPEQNLLPRNLISLRISRLQNLKVLDYKGLQHLTSLETLKINGCNKLRSLPDEGLPSSLSYLYISDCPLLNSKLQNRRGKEWFKIAHIPHIQIDGKVIS